MEVGTDLRRGIGPFHRYFDGLGTGGLEEGEGWERDVSTPRSPPREELVVYPIKPKSLGIDLSIVAFRRSRALSPLHTLPSSTRNA